MQSKIEEWILNFVSVHNEKLNNIPCPYAKKALVRYVETEQIGSELHQCNINWSDAYEVVCIYTPTNLYTVKEVKDLVNKFNKNDIDLVALEDHPNDEEVINGAKMNFGKCILVLVQRLSKLTEASNHLKANGYYEKWSKENLDDVVNWRNK